LREQRRCAGPGADQVVLGFWDAGEQLDLAADQALVAVIAQCPRGPLHHAFDHPRGSIHAARLGGNAEARCPDLVLRGGCGVDWGGRRRCEGARVGAPRRGGAGWLGGKLTLEQRQRLREEAGIFFATFHAGRARRGDSCDSRSSAAGRGYGKAVWGRRGQGWAGVSGGMAGG